MKTNKPGYAGAIALSGLIALASASVAQTNTGGPGKKQPMTTEARLKQMTEQIGLKEDQQAKIKPILEDLSKKRAAITQDDPDRRAKMTAATDEATKKIEEVLTPEQKQKFQDNGGLRGRPSGKGGKKGGKGAPPSTPPTQQ